MVLDSVQPGSCFVVWLYWPCFWTDSTNVFCDNKLSSVRDSSELKTRKSTFTSFPAVLLLPAPVIHRVRQLWIAAGFCSSWNIISPRRCILTSGFCCLLWLYLFDFVRVCPLRYIFTHIHCLLQQSRCICMTSSYRHFSVLCYVLHNRVLRADNLCCTMLANINTVVTLHWKPCSYK